MSKEENQYLIVATLSKNVFLQTNSYFKYYV